MKLTVLHDGSLKPRKKHRSPDDMVKKSSGVGPEYATPELDLIDKYDDYMTGLSVSMSNNLSMAPRDPSGMYLEPGVSK